MDDEKTGLDILIQMLAEEKGQGSLVKEVAARVRADLAAALDAITRLEQSYRAYYRLGGATMPEVAGLLAERKIAPARAVAIEAAEKEPEAAPVVEPLPDRDTPILVETAYGPEIVPPFRPKTVYPQTPVKVRPKGNTNNHRTRPVDDVPLQDIIAFCQMVETELGEKPPIGIVAEYFNKTYAWAQDRMVKAKREGFELGRDWGSRAPAGFSALVKAKFGTYKKP